jgi:pepF/M3 family oligoendopeptidase
VANHYRLTWDLDSLFAGGSKSPAVLAHLDSMDADLAQLRNRTEALPEPDTEAGLAQWHEVLMANQALVDRFSEAGGFLYCLTAQDVKDTGAKVLMGRVQQLGAAYGAIDIALRDRIARLPEPTWARLLADERFSPLAFNLQEIRRDALEQMDTGRETLANDLAVDGYHAWGRFYSTVVGRVQVPFEVDGQIKQLSAGQAFNKFSEPDPAVRAKLFADWEAAWGEQAELCAEALNHLAGFRLALYKHRGWDLLKQPLDMNRMTRATLDAMWNAVEGGKDLMVRYLQRKAELMGTGAFHWYDEFAPLTGDDRKLSFDEAAEFIVGQFGRFSPRMAAFAQRAFDQHWIEAEDRPGKMPGGFCTPMGVSRQSRIFLTFSGKPAGVSVIAHELGHAFHFDVMWDIPPLARQYAMNVAETASTFAELVVAKAAIAAAPSTTEKLALLDNAIRRNVSMFLNVHARYLFETRFYAARQAGPLGIDQLNELMVQAQRDAFQNSLATYHPLFWASKAHFYMTGAPLYNFPYTFGFLFSAGIYARAMAEGPGFEQKYIDLLRDTARMTVEDLAQRHLGVDLMQPGFWEDAVRIALGDVVEFLELTESE